MPNPTATAAPSRCAIRRRDTAGTDHWINPIHVHALRVAKKAFGGVKGTEIWLNWNSDGTAITVPDEPDKVAELLSAAMALIAPFAPPALSPAPPAPEA
ncbi:MAG: hypothetical protein IBJ11_12130 [Phycisphaerales bacterium]|nr:hypothetical protein [Phycisphaerales bacterium]